MARPPANLRRAGAAALFVLLAACAAAPVGADEAAGLGPLRLFAVKDDFLSRKREVSRDLSGVACRPSQPGAARRLCVVIDDQSRFAQVAWLADDALEAGAKIPLIDAAQEEAALGAPPAKVSCPQKESRFEDLDGEGVAYDAPWFYIIGSHGCTRKKGEFSRSAFLTVRFRLDDEGRLVEGGGPAVEATYRLSDALAAARMAQAHFAAPLAEAGLNIEGVAVRDGVLYAGARAPSIDGKALLIGVNIADLFAPGHERRPMQIVESALPLGEGVGVRDLATLPDGRLLVLAGPEQEDCRTPFSLFVSDFPPSRGGTPNVQLIARLKDVPAGGDEFARAKAEAVLPLSILDGELRALILFDGPKNGRPSEYRALLPR